MTKQIYRNKYYYQSAVINNMINKPRLAANFNVRDFSGKKMAYVEVKELNTGKVLFEGNSLWGLGSLKEEELINKIKNYNHFEEINRDFGC